MAGQSIDQTTEQLLRGKRRALCRELAAAARAGQPWRVDALLRALDAYGGNAESIGRELEPLGFGDLVKHYYKIK